MSKSRISLEDIDEISTADSMVILGEKGGFGMSFNLFLREAVYYDTRIHNVLPLLKINTDERCRNMSRHVLMGRPAARLEMMALVIRSYVLVYIVGKRR